MFDKKDARRDFMKNGPDGASRSLTRSPFLQKHICLTKDARRDFTQNGPDGASRSPMGSPLMKKTNFLIFTEFGYSGVAGCWLHSG